MKTLLIKEIFKAIRVAICTSDIDCAIPQPMAHQAFASDENANGLCILRRRRKPMLKKNIIRDGKNRVRAVASPANGAVARR